MNHEIPLARRQWVRATVTAGLAVGLLAGCSSSAQSTTPAASTPTGTLSWRACNDPVAQDPELQCATLTVPLDYDKPKGATIDLALVRLPATQKRVGAVLTNPGGPGGSGFEWIAAGGSALRSQLGLEQFDLVGFDPRGVDRSGGLRCLTDAQMDAAVYLDANPDTAEERAALASFDDLWRTACSTKYGDTLRQYSTANTARDLDAIRVALGDTQISYFGVSYGTYLGAVYATMFPDRVRAMVLDAAFDPDDESAEQQIATQYVGFERAFDNWASWCRATPDECTFGTGDVGAAWDALFEKLDTTPVRAADGRFANNTVLGMATITALYSKSMWPALATALDQVRAGDATTLLTLADVNVGRNANGTYSTLQQSIVVITCASGYSPAPEDVDAAAVRVRTTAPRFGRLLRVQDLEVCPPSMAGATASPIAYTGKAPIVVIGGANDPATPLRWSEKLTPKLGTNSRLVTFTGEGHGFVEVSSCVAQLAGAALVKAELPANGTRCEPDKVATRPEWWNSLTTPSGVSNPVAVSAAALGLGPSVFLEVRTTDLGVAAVADAYDKVLRSAGFTAKAGDAPSATGRQTEYRNGDRTITVLVLGRDDLAAPSLRPLADAVGSPAATVLLATRT
jgi:pimeloyl-ACP methyl ester carboxylesterase